jgi:hypothetical protein
MRVIDDRRALLIAIVLAIVMVPVQYFLFLYLGGAITFTLVDAIIGLGLKPHVSWLMRSANAVIWSGILGVLFGVPLGLAAKAHVVRYWFVFVIAATVAYAVLSLWSELGFGAALMTWGMPEYWLYFVGVLCFASAMPWIQRQLAWCACAAP